MIFDVILVVSGDDLDKLNKVCFYINKNIKPNEIVVITNEKEKAKKLITEKNVCVQDEKNILEPLSQTEILKYSIVGFPKRYFWYYQQFLKMAYCYSCKNKYYLIWDADTIPLKRMDFFCEDKVTPIITIGTEKLHHEYVATAEKLLSAKIETNNSFISQHLLVDSLVMRELIESIGGKMIFSTQILQSLDGKTASQFSEYETYVNYYLLKNNKVKIIKRNWFRFGSSLIGFSPEDTMLTKMSKYYEYIAFEKFDIGLKNKIRSNFLHIKNMFKKVL
ncbi:DUF6492 family protein [Symbiopectobacterium purcellii]|uniref:DUF6492 family protein n=1 Tax=Symbiopectobacterium purcellii TaxID=2871826 RepID=UPI003F832571